MRKSVAHAALLVLIVIVVALSVGSGRFDSATSDEPAYIATGMIKLVEGRLDYFRDEPPLMNSLSALPLVVAGYRLPPIWNLDSDHWAVGKKFLWRSGFDGQRMLFLARLPTIALFIALVITMYWFVLRETHSAGWALAAAALVGFCPNLMAHGRLATVDLALSFFTFLAAALFVVVVQSDSIPAAIGMGIASAAAILTKTSGNILGPYFLLLLLIAVFVAPESWGTGQRKRLMTLFGIAVLSAVVFAVLFILAEARTINPAVPFREYAENLRLISGWYTRGHFLPQFLLGRFSTSGFPMYYFVAFLLKTTIPALLLFIAAIVLRKRSFAFVAMTLFIALFLGVAAAGHLNLGLRYVLPVYPFVYAATAIALSRIESRAFAVAVTVLIAWHVAENVAAYPSYISYFNELIGSKRNADQYLIDSNLDWGQDLRRVDMWCRDHDVRVLTLHYFGGADPAYDVRSVRPLLLRGPGYGPLPKGHFALSRHLYRVSFAPGIFPMNYDEYLTANHARLVATVGGSINIYAIE